MDKQRLLRQWWAEAKVFALGPIWTAVCLGQKSTDLEEPLSASSKLLTLILLKSNFITACFKDCGAEIQIWLEIVC